MALEGYLDDGAVAIDAPRRVIAARDFDRSSARKGRNLGRAEAGAGVGPARRRLEVDAGAADADRRGRRDQLPPRAGREGGAEPAAREPQEVEHARGDAVRVE